MRSSQVRDSAKLKDFSAPLESKGAKEPSITCRISLFVGGFFSSTQKPKYKKVGGGSDKLVWMKVGPSSDTAGAAKAYYTPNRAFGMSRAKVLEKEFNIVKDLEKACEEKNIDTTHLFVGWEKTEDKKISVTLASSNLDAKICPDKEGNKIDFESRIHLNCGMLEGLDP